MKPTKLVRRELAAATRIERLYLTNRCAEIPLLVPTLCRAHRAVTHNKPLARTSLADGFVNYIDRKSMRKDWYSVYEAAVSLRRLLVLEWA